MTRHLSCVLLTVTALGFAGGCDGGLPEADLVFISGSEHNLLDPQRMSWSHDIRLAHCLYDTLVNFDFNDYSIHPATAERWEISDDGLTYTFHIRSDAKWSNGDAVTADDFIYAWRRAMLPDLAADYTQLLFHIKGARSFYDWRTEHLGEYARIKKQVKGTTSAGDAAKDMWQLTEDKFLEMVGLSAPDDKTLVVKLERPVAYFLQLVAFSTYMPAHQKSVEAITQVNSITGALTVDSSYFSSPITNGPYRIVERRFQRYILLAANDNYWNRTAMKNSSIREDIITHPQTALASYNAGQADFLPDLPSAGDMAANLAAQQREDVHLQMMAGTYFYNFNCLEALPDGTNNPLADRRVRRALAMAIDRKVIVERVTQLHQPIARSYVPVGAISTYQPPVEDGITFDLERAQQLLAEAGYPGGKGLDGLSILYNTGHDHERIAQVIQNMWQKHLGVVVTLEGIEGKAFSTRLKQQNYTIARASWFGDYHDPTTFLEKMTTHDGNNDCRWSNEKFDNLLTQAGEQSDPAARIAILQQAESILLDDAPMALIYQYVNIYLYDPERVRGLRPNGWHRWRLEQAQIVKSSP
jgi:oligopeptide transport system substrate-binding protein